MTRHRKKLLWILAALASAALFPLLWKSWVGWYYGGLIYGVSETPPRRVAIVFGAAIYSEDRLSAVLRDRMETAISLYEAGIVQKLLVSGDNRFENYNEPTAMMTYAIRRGVPEEDIQPDFAGRRTYDTCYLCYAHARSAPAISFRCNRRCSSRKTFTCPAPSSLATA